MVKKLEHNATLDPYGYEGHIEGNTSDVRRMMRQMEKSLHHLQNEINEMLHPPVQNHGDFGVGGGYYTPRYRSPRYRSPRHGFSYRNGDFAIRFGH